MADNPGDRGDASAAMSAQKAPVQPGVSVSRDFLSVGYRREAEESIKKNYYSEKQTQRRDGAADSHGVFSPGAESVLRHARRSRIISGD